MSDLARRSATDLKPLAPGLSVEVLDWAVALRAIWGALGLTMGQFVCLYGQIDKGTISRYLNGQRVPRERWFLDKLLAIQADYGEPVTPAVREHLAELQLRALAVAHPHEYRVRLVNDELVIALTGKREAERYARALEERLADRIRQVAELAEAKDRLRAAWDADRVATQAQCERLTQEIGEITGQLRLARERAADAERHCQLLEGVLDRLGAHAPTGDECRIDVKSGLLTEPAWELAAVYEINRAIQAGIPLALAVVSIDDFKVINNIYGQLAGDQAIRAVADALRSQLRAYDVAARFRSGEFVILLPHAHEAEAANAAEEIRCHIAALAIPAADSGPCVTLTVSVGVAALDGESRSLTDMLAAAQDALPSDKRTSRLDAQTGLLATEVWKISAHAEIRRAVQTGYPMALMLVALEYLPLRSLGIVDIDGQIGANVLRAVAGALRSQLRFDDLPGRFSRHMFAILLPHAREVDALELAEQVRVHIAGLSIPVCDNDKSGPCVMPMVSVGVAGLSIPVCDNDKSGPCVMPMVSVGGADLHSVSRSLDDLLKAADVRDNLNDPSF